MVGVEAGGDGIIPERHAARFQGGKLGVLQDTKTWLLANDDGQIELTHSVSASLDYAAIGPEHALLQDIGRIGEISGLLGVGPSSGNGGSVR